MVASLPSQLTPGQVALKSLLPHGSSDVLSKRRRAVAGGAQITPVGSGEAAQSGLSMRRTSAESVTFMANHVQWAM